MEISPLQLESYSFSDIQITAQENPNTSDFNDIGGEEMFGMSPDDNRNWHVLLTIELNAAEDTKPSYLGRMKVEGVFQVHEKWPEEKIEALVSSNATALLFGAVREMLVNLTARSKHGPIKLKTVRFPARKLSDDSDQETPE
jgi:preprotein translocase subunit SecB